MEMKLDVGCGSNPRGEVNIDIFMSKAHNFVHCDAHILPFKSDGFTEVVSYQTLEHVERPLTVAQEIYRVLKQAGTLELSTPNNHFILLPLMTALMGEYRGYSPNHIYFWDRPILGNLLKRAGFKHFQYSYMTLPGRKHSLLGRIILFLTRFWPNLCEVNVVVNTKK